MGAFLSSRVLGARCKHFVPDTVPAASGDPRASSQDAIEYELVAVVAHSGQLEGGHYVACVPPEDPGMLA